MELKKYSTALGMILLSLSISSCSLLRPKPPVVEIKTIEVKVPITHPTPPSPIQMTGISWYVVSSKNREEFLERIEKEGNGVFVALTVEDYENLSYNMQEIRRWVNQSKEILFYYRNIDKPEESEVEEDE